MYCQWIMILQYNKTLACIPFCTWLDSIFMFLHSTVDGMSHVDTVEKDLLPSLLFFGTLGSPCFVYCSPCLARWPAYDPNLSAPAPDAWPTVHSKVQLHKHTGCAITIIIIKLYKNYFFILWTRFNSNINPTWEVIVRYTIRMHKIPCMPVCIEMNVQIKK